MADGPRFEFRETPEIEAGVYANFVRVWHTPHDFTLDFAVALPADRPDENVAFQVVSRVKISPSLVFDLLRTINENMTIYEQQYGDIKRPEVYEEPDDGD